MEQVIVKTVSLNTKFNFVPTSVPIGLTDDGYCVYQYRYTNNIIS